MLKQKVTAISIGLSLMLSLMACSQAAENQTTSVKEAFLKHFPDKVVSSVNTTPVSGLFEIVVNKKQIVYSNADASYLLIGDLINSATKESLTEKRAIELNKVDVSMLPLNDAIKDVRGNGKRTLYVFSDPDCPYCKRLERESLKGISDVTIYTFLFPLTQLHPDAMNKAKKIWCAKDRSKVWNDFMIKDTALPNNTKCDTSTIEKNEQLGKKLGINGTPALIFANGQMIPGAIDSKSIEKLLDQK